MDIKTVYICPMCGRKIQGFVNGKIEYAYLEVVCSCGYNHASRGSARAGNFSWFTSSTQVQNETSTRIF